MSIQIKLSNNATIPTKGSEHAAAFDLKSIEAVTVLPKQRALVSTGVQMSIPKNYYGQILSRSGLASKLGVIVLGGVIDSDYRGEVKVILLNTSDTDFQVNIGDKIAQIAFIKLFEGSLEAVDTLDETVRDAQGFGSTGN